MIRHSPAKKSLGQNFLVDRRIVTRIIAAAELTPEDTVLEVGPGRGTLTRPLAENVRKSHRHRTRRQPCRRSYHRIRLTTSCSRHPRRCPPCRYIHHRPAACSLQAHRKSAVLRSSTHRAPLPRSRAQANSDGHNVAARGRPHHDRRTRRHVAALRSNATLWQAAHSHFRTPTRIPSCAQGDISRRSHRRVPEACPSYRLH